ncbi:hypothetical protein [Mucilaginibacter sp.]|uniref:hypothetical protein n=1 Tax=Mucilaginibacter sp. TaxID=1882438 RepID=UPI003D104A63
MEQNINNSQYDFLWKLLADPATDAHLYNYNLQRLVNDFPQSGILQALLAHASDEKNLRRASVYFNARSLYKLINSPSAIGSVANDRIVIQPNGHASNLSGYQTHSVDTSGADNYFSDLPAAESAIEETEHTWAHQPEAIEHEVTQTVAGEHQHVEETISHTPAPEESFETLHNEPHEIAAPEHVHEAPVEAAAEEIHPESSIVHEVLNEANVEEHAPADELPAIETEITEAVRKHDPFEYGYNHANAVYNTGIEAVKSEEETHQPIEQVNETVHAVEHTEVAAPADHHDLQEEVPVEHHFAEHIDDTPNEEHSAPVEEVFHEIAALEHVHENDEPVASFSESIAHEEAPEETHQTEATEHPNHNIEEETFDEIVGIDQINLHDEADRLILGSIASSDYFLFDRAFGEHKDATPVDDSPVTVAQPLAEEPVKNKPVADTTEPVFGAPAAEEADQQDVSKYHDEKMPYSFLWWLDKTRKEHATINQPYAETEKPVSTTKKRANTDELQQQYYENIFHITSVEELDKSVPPPAEPFNLDPLKKEHVIIERFIQEEPQIKPQSSDKLDNENKAKKSSEDRDEMVTETLAAIYSDQMLYHKAIASYRKLMLKFPEKSSYFAGKIEQLEKKTN